MACAMRDLVVRWRAKRREAAELYAARGCPSEVGTRARAQCLQGEGAVMLSGFGHTWQTELREGETLRLDPGHLVAWTSGMAYKIVKGSRAGLGASMLSGELTALKFYGPGTIHQQSHKLMAASSMHGIRTNIISSASANLGSAASGGGGNGGGGASQG